jgi:hypothetical protein
VLLGSVAALVLVVALWWFVGGDDSDDDLATAPDTSITTPAPEENPPGTAPPSGSPPEEQPDAGDRVAMLPTGDDELDAVIDAAARYVEDARGMRFREPVLVEVLDDDDFVERLRSEFEDDSVEDLELIQRLYVAVGFLDDDVDLVETFRSLLDAGVAGFFDPETAELVVRGADTSLYTQQTIVHELVHALDHQWFDLDRPELSDAEDESSFGFSAVVEGSAMVVQNAWARDLDEDDRRALRRQEMEAALAMDFDPFAFPIILVQVISAPYEFGENLVAELILDGGTQRLDEALLDPPTTSQQVMHPQKYLDRLEPVAVDPPPADGPVLDEGVFGEFVLWLLLDREVAATEARRAAEGWSGDRYVAWEDGTRTCVRVDVATSTPSDGDALSSALEVWARAQDAADTERVTDDLVRFTSCG